MPRRLSRHGLSGRGQQGSDELGCGCRRMTPTDDCSESTDGAALAVLLAQRASFLAFLERRLGSRELAEELLQDAYARGIERLSAIRADESAVAWFYRLLRNAIVDRRRRQGAGQRALAKLAEELRAE